MTALPSVLPRPQRAGYSLAVTAAATATQRDRAVARCRRHGLASRTVVTLAWLLTDDQHAIWAAWWRHDLGDGTQTATIALINGHSDAAQAVRFLGPYVADDLDGRWRISVSAELIDPPRLSADDVAGILAEETFSLPADDLHTLVHSTYPARILP